VIPNSIILPALLGFCGELLGFVLQDRTSCPMYKFEDAYEAYLYREGYLSSTSSPDAVPELVQAIQDLRQGLDELKERAKFREPRINSCCVVLGCLNLVVMSLGILLYFFK
jgi:hypothetical protein